MMMIMSLVTFFLVLKNAEDNSLSFSASHMPHSLHPLPLPARLLSFSPDDDGMRLKKLYSKSRRKNLKKCLGRCEREYLRVLSLTWSGTNVISAIKAVTSQLAYNCTQLVAEFMNISNISVIQPIIRIIVYYSSLSILSIIVTVFSLVCDTVIVIFLKKDAILSVNGCRCRMENQTVKNINYFM